MKPRGREVLYSLRDLEEVPGVRWVMAGDLAKRLRLKDGRAITQTLQDLERCGLTQRWPELTHPNWRTTERGREVERIVSAADAHRGGSFRPLIDLPLDQKEVWVLAR